MNNEIGKIDQIKEKKLKKKIKMSPPFMIMLSFLGIIIIGSMLLMFPFAQKQYVSYLNVLFTSTSAVCVTGLSVLNISEYFTVYGQIIILILIQAGGLGFMSMTTFIFIFIGKKITLRERLTLSEAYSEENLQGLVKLTLVIVLFTAVIEAAGAVLLSFSFVPQYGFLKGVFFALFHSVSAFCNAGLDITGSNFMGYTSDVLVNLSIMSLIFLGGIGFAVIKDIITSKKLSKFSFNTKVVLFTSLFLIVVSSAFYAMLEWNNAGTLGNESISGKILGSFFQAVTTRTAGFNTIDQGQMTGASKFITVINMFIGASPASTGGGLKTTTAFMILFFFISGIKGEEKEVTAFGKSISLKYAHKAILLLIYSLLLVTIFTILIFFIESGNREITTGAILFEVVSAFGTVGLSMGITAQLTAVSKILIIILMFIGRLGSLVLSMLIFKYKKKDNILIKHPEVKIVIG